MQIGVRPDDQTKLYEEIEKLTGWERPQTNKEWIQSATTEHLAIFLAIVQYDGTDLTLKKNHVKKWVEWLKQPHANE